MLFVALSVLMIGLSSVLAGPFSNKALCGFSPSDEIVAKAEAHFEANKVSLNARAEYAATIQVYWHVIQSGNSMSLGNIPDSQITASITALNSHFSGTGLTFILADTDRTTNADWFNEGRTGSMKVALHRGGAATLNVYSASFKRGGILGYATSPDAYSRAPRHDGVVIDYSTVPGGSWHLNNDGKILTHEVGHWVGLEHTGQGGYCPFVPGVIHNYMDEGSGYCLAEFTPSQVTRMREQIATYRNIKG